MSDFAEIYREMMEQTSAMARKFAPDAAAMFSPGALEAMMPGVGASFLEAFFGNSINVNGLDARTRFLVTIAGLTSQPALTEPQLKLAIQSALVAGAGQQEITEVILQMSMFGGMAQTTRALQVALEVFKEKDGKDE